MALNTAAIIAIQEFLDSIQLWVDTYDQNSTSIGLDSKHLATRLLTKREPRTKVLNFLIKKQQCY